MQLCASVFKKCKHRQRVASKVHIMTDYENHSGSMLSEYGVRRDLLLKAQQAVLRHVLPALHAAIDDVTNFVYEPNDDDEEIHGHLRELATETVIDEVVRLLTRDLVPVSQQYLVSDVDGISIDTLIACYGELTEENARQWYAHEMHLDASEYQSLSESLPDHMQM